VQTVVEHLERFQDMTPVLALVIQSLVQHIHDLVEVGRAGAAVSAASEFGRRILLVEGDLSDLGHVGAHGTPWIVAGRYNHQYEQPVNSPSLTYHCAP
jgi:hypothetical protein